MPPLNSKLMAYSADFETKLPKLTISLPDML